MEKLKIKIHGIGQPYVHDENVDFILHENGWDDFNYRTVYTIVATPKLLESKHGYEIGTISIVKSGQDTGINVLCRSIKKEDSIITELPNGFVSVSRDPNLANILFCILSPVQRKEFIRAMHMILGNDEYYNVICSDNCFRVSVMRGINEEYLMAFLEQSHRLMHSELKGKNIIKSYAYKILK